jgi:hypothetical protein
MRNKNILSYFNNKIIAGGLFKKKKKAFNCVNYGILLSKMKFYGISGVTNKLMESYLGNRYQTVVINAHSNSKGYFSKREEVQHGVPQGSFLGPLLFLIYINDLSESVSDKCSSFLYADDTTFIIPNRDETKFNFNTNKIFNEINKWFHSNLLMLNYDKTYFLQFLTKTDCEINMQVSFGNRKISATQSLKFLGPTIDTFLTWKNIGELTTRLNKAYYAIRSIKPLCP